ncbi:putative phage protein (TIGR01671 family) [Cytobacillus horneckiae]|uniref:YopX family protein n=1 Tax=Cytobacillus horneckiae TaxID=549687 RepID=UPI0019D1476E|nr:YopX family protein [Cytobacillus horneckiae]MBN6886223.1 hypothetical protein [Cytobacillus horneckiae]
MREIKFRAWENNLKEIIPVHSIDFEKKIINSESAWRFFNEIKLMQYTGLKDKNGKEIYEGDVVKRPLGGYGVVKFHKSWGSFYCSTFLAVDENGDLVKASSSVLFWNDSNKFEVVGNIYEHPELINS